MHNLSLSARGQYRNKKGTLVFRYAVKGSASAMQAYEDAQGQYYVVDQDTNEVLFFTPRFAGKTATLIVTEEGKVYVDMSELEQQASLIAQFGGNLGQAMADAFTRKLSGGSSSAPAPAAPKAESKPDESLPEPAAAPATRRVRR